MLSLDEIENNEVIPIVYTQHTHAFLCVPLCASGSAKSVMWWPRWKADVASPNIYSFAKPWTWNLLKPLEWKLHSGFQGHHLTCQNTPRSWMSHSVQKGCSENCTSWQATFLFWFSASHHLRARCCKPGHCGLIFVVWREIVRGSTPHLYLVSSLFVVRLVMWSVCTDAFTQIKCKWSYFDLIWLESEWSSSPFHFSLWIWPAKQSESMPRIGLFSF